MSVLGYEAGPIACEAAFIADFDVDRSITIEAVVSRMDSDRRTMASRAGMVMKYMPLRFDPATGAHQIGGRYLFDTLDNMRDYIRFTTEDLEFEPGIKFWQRPFFSNIDKTAWRVVGAHNFTPVETHYATRVERIALTADTTFGMLEAVWPAMREKAEREELAALWLLAGTDQNQVALLSAATKRAGDDDAKCASHSLSTLERRPSLSRCLSGRAHAQPLFDRTSLNLAVWLPRSDALGGESCIFPTYPVHPRPPA